MAIGGGRDSKLAAMALVASTLMSDQQNYVLQPLVVVLISWSSSLLPSTCFDSFISSFKNQTHTHTHRVSRMFQASFQHVVVHEGRGNNKICKKLVTIIGFSPHGCKSK
jgi:hypothetical protein